MALPGGAGGRTEAVLTCPGEIDDPNFPKQCSLLINRLQKALGNDDVRVLKCEPWNSVKITFDLPAEAAEKLSALAQSGDDVLREMGILSLQIQGGQIISMTVMSDEELRQRKSAKTSNSSVKLEANSSDNSIPSTSSLLVNLLQNKDNLLESSKVSGDSESTTKNKSVNQSQVASRLPNKVPGAIGQNNLESDRSQNTQSKSLMPPPSSPLTSGASGTIPTLTGDPGKPGSIGRQQQQILINPNTGVLESGPESHSPDHTHHNTNHPDLEALAQRVKSDKALKLKLKLPNPPSQPLNQVKSPSTSSSSSSSNSGSSTDSSKHSENSATNSGPKLPKLILSMRDKTVKLSNNKKRSHGEVEATEDDFKASKAKSPKRTLESDVKSEHSSSTSIPNKMQPQQQPQQNSNHCVTSVSGNSKSLNSNQESINSDGSSTKKHERLSAWAKSITSRLDKGAFSNAMNHDHDNEDGMEKGTFDLKGKVEVKREVVHVNHVRLQPNASLLEVKKEPSFPEVTTSMDTTTASTTIKTLSLPNGPTPTESSRDPIVKSEVQPQQPGLSDLEPLGGGKLENNLPHLPPQEPPDNQACNQQGEDSGIESMDTLSEKSPNQGENPYPNEERMDMVINKSSPTGSSISSNSPITSSSTDISSTTVQSKVASVASTMNSSVSPNSSNSSSNSDVHTSDNHSKLSSEVSSAKVVLKNIPAQLVQEVVAPPVEAMEVGSELSRSTPSPVMFNGHNGSSTTTTAGNVTVRPAHMVPPGAKMVPVKLVRVSAEGNVSLVRVSPVKSTSVLNTSVAITPSLPEKPLVAATPPGAPSATQSGTTAKTVIIKSTSATSNSTNSTNSLNSGPPITPLTLVSSIKDSNNTKDSSNTNVVLVGEKATSSTSATPSTTPPGVSLRPSLSIMPVFEPPSGQSGTMSMKDVVESINRKNLESIEPLEIDVKTASKSSATTSTTTASTAVKQPRIGPLAKRSPMQLPEHNFVGGGSLLKPLLATPTNNQKDNSSTSTTTSTTATTSTLASSESSSSSNLSTTVISTMSTSATSAGVNSNHVGDNTDEKKRRRRDTDSSTKSDKSDISLISVESSNSVTTSNATSAPPSKKKNTGGVALVESVSKKSTPIKARKGANAVKATKKEDDKVEVNNTATVKKPTRVENARNKAKPATVVTTTTASTPTVINLDQEISRRSIRQSTPTPPTTASRPPSGRSHTPTRQTHPQSASNATTNSQAPKLNKKANNSQLKKVVPEEKPKRNSSPVNSGSSIVQNLASNAASAASAANNEAKKGMKTRSAKSATASAVGRS